MGTKARVRKIRKIPPLVEEERERVKERAVKGIPILQPKGNTV